MNRFVSYFLRFPLLRRIAKKLYNAGLLKGFLKTNPKVIEISDFAPLKRVASERKRLCVFASFAPSSIIHEYVFYYLAALKQVGFDIVFVSTSPAISEGDMSRLKGLVWKCVRRQNVGYDFGSYKAGLLHAGVVLEEYDQLLFTNDSCYGPLYPLKPVFAQMDKRNLDLWGMADNFEIAYHLMSYFLVFNRETFLSPQFLGFWKSLVMFPAQAKQLIIQKYEIGISRLVIAMGKTIGAYCAYENVLDLPSLSDKRESQGLLTHRQSVYCASVHYYWREMIVHAKFPFIKADVVRKNPTQSRVLDWPQVIAKTDYPVDLIWSSIKIDR